jgi:hypothetical protein
MRRLSASLAAALLLRNYTAMGGGLNGPGATVAAWCS